MDLIFMDLKFVYIVCVQPGFPPLYLPTSKLKNLKYVYSSTITIAITKIRSIVTQYDLL